MKRKGEDELLRELGGERSWLKNGCSTYLTFEGEEEQG
jgi:hypothetical protein